VILVVDDDPDLLEVVRVVLESAGYTVRTAGSAEEAVRRFRDGPPDLVIVDLMMEEIDSGIGLVKELQRLGNRAPVFMLSSLGDSLHDTIDHSELGLAAVFQKPLDAKALLATVEQSVPGPT
jgi:DNA-binding response OmpR family regulator